MLSVDLRLLKLFFGMVLFIENIVGYMIPVEVKALSGATSFMFNALSVFVLESAPGAACGSIEGIPYCIAIATLPVSAAIGLPVAFGTIYSDISH